MCNDSILRFNKGSYGEWATTTTKPKYLYALKSLNCDRKFCSQPNIREQSYVKSLIKDNYQQYYKKDNMKRMGNYK